EIELMHPNFSPVRKTMEVKGNRIITLAHTLKQPRGTHTKTIRPSRQQAVEPYPNPSNATAGILERPTYIEALIHMTIGEYRKALILLDSLKERPETSRGDRLLIAAKMQECYRGLGDFERALRVHERRGRSSTDDKTKAMALWQTANIRATCLGDYLGAERDLVRYIASYPSGVWIEQAYLRLADIQSMAGDFNAASRTYRRYLARFPSRPDRPKALHALARLLENEQEKYQEAVELYDIILAEFPSSEYAENALFHRAHCRWYMGQIDKATADCRNYSDRYPDGFRMEACRKLINSAQAMR
ncbi:MAG: tetratricopeptide repeat protein, partial [Chitinivibrionales bacterium]|nr:tetratricopeptide repeat protein [Chitinivibrionales bacterium]MBD3357413.1 tetratricopeptide repeat protein [Chitinivibrionales bacterium]